MIHEPMEYLDHLSGDTKHTHATFTRRRIHKYQREGEGVHNEDEITRYGREQTRKKGDTKRARTRRCRLLSLH